MLLMVECSPLKFGCGDLSGSHEVRGMTVGMGGGGQLRKRLLEMERSRN